MENVAQLKYENQAQNTHKLRFGRISFSAIESPNLSRMSKNVFFVLTFHANKSGTCFPRIKKIASDLRVSRRSVFRALAQLEAEGMIERTKIEVGESCGRTLYTLKDYTGPYGFITQSLFSTDTQVHRSVLAVIQAKCRVYGYADIPVNDIAKALGYSRNTVQSAITQLRAAGKLHIERLGRGNRYRVGALPTFNIPNPSTTTCPMGVTPKTPINNKKIKTARMHLRNRHGGSFFPQHEQSTAKHSDLAYRYTQSVSARNRVLDPARYAAYIETGLMTGEIREDELLAQMGKTSERSELKAEIDRRSEQARAFAREWESAEEREASDRAKEQHEATQYLASLPLETRRDIQATAESNFLGSAAGQFIGRDRTMWGPMVWQAVRGEMIQIVIDAGFQIE